MGLLSPLLPAVFLLLILVLFVLFVFFFLIFLFLWICVVWAASTFARNVDSTEVVFWSC